MSKVAETSHGIATVCCETCGKPYFARCTTCRNFNHWEPNEGTSPSQTAKADAGKLDLTLVPLQIIEDVAEVREYGNRKYGDPDNWKTVDIQRYRAALFRHLLAYLRDPDGVDKESGISHYKHMACNMAFICEMEKERNKEC